MSELAAFSYPLAASERSRLATLEAVVERGLGTFVEVGQALLEIQRDSLFREMHGTFEDYCRARWNISRDWAYKQIRAAEVAVLVDHGLQPNERQARELVPLRDEPEQLREAWAEASADGEPTALKVRDAVSRRMDVHYSSERDDWSTPQDLFDALNAEFHFDLDVCATPSSAKCAKYFTPELDGLAHEWTGSCWMNPPYGDEIKTWVKKAYDSRTRATVVCLVPARVDTGWWWDYCRQGDVRFLRGRLRFGGGETGAPFPSAVVVFPGNGHTLYWEWK